MTYANDCIRQEKIKIPANNLPDCTIISIFEIDDNYYRVFSVCSQLKDQFHYSGRQRENRVMHGSSLAAIWFGHRSWGKQRVRAYFFETTNCMHYDFHIVCHNYVAGRYSLPFMAATTASRTLGTKQIALYRGVAGFVVLI